ncbi:hypothetical protein TH61_04650 [Rufibacter sp. DG15C]|uniref:hypothetical protein n=1 Tax=Rufibacter sp. DG15C TaxID=1379909 RepID=UPI00078D602E|nr:hypothetical protein [Rufibacter sp. DG15C]AMM52750.1 hypothetical protein TH61_04650 [Rufibacter sp. DG15C]
MRKYLLILLACICFPCSWAFGQNVEEEETYTREFTYGINFNSNGGLIGGLMIKSAYHLTNNWYQFWAIEGVEVKHPKEYRYQNVNTGANFVFGKSNYFFVLRPEYGREYTFFKKAAESGVQVNGIAAIGPSIGIQAPYYIDYDRSRYVYNPQTRTYYRTGEMIVASEPYDPAIHNDALILGSSGPFKGLGDPTFKVGAHVKAGVSFEYGRYMESVTGIEVGMVYEAFTDKIPIIPVAEQSSHFTSVYLTLYYGRRR